MHFSISTLSLFASAATAAYVLKDDYSASAFAGMFDFFTDNDPTNGYVNYISQSQAESAGLYKVIGNQVYMGVDATNVATGRGRDSIRISSKNTYDHGLIILDLAHMPGGACGTWPAFWTLGANWPNNGEVDIIEGVNSQQANTMAMHTNAGCTITNTGAFSGTLQTEDCNVAAPDQPTNAGCSISAAKSNSFGSGFNNNGGGVYAMQWTSEAVSIWFFPRGGIPSDIPSGTPDPSGWGLPSGQFAGGCDIDSKLISHQLIFDVTFCGDWAGNVWSTDSTCASQGSSCQAFVQNNPAAFQDTYWLINSLRVYSDNGAPAPPVPNPSQSQPATSTETQPPATATSTFYTVTTSVPGETQTPPTPTGPNTETSPTFAPTIAPTASSPPYSEPPWVPGPSAPDAQPTGSPPDNGPGGWRGGGDGGGWSNNGQWGDWRGGRPGRGGWQPGK